MVEGSGELAGYRCVSCRKGFATQEERSHHYRTTHPDRTRPKVKKGFWERVREDLRVEGGNPNDPLGPDW